MQPRQWYSAIQLHTVFGWQPVVARLPSTRVTVNGPRNRGFPLRPRRTYVCTPPCRSRSIGMGSTRTLCAASVRRRWPFCTACSALVQPVALGEAVLNRWLRQCATICARRVSNKSVGGTTKHRGVRRAPSSRMHPCAVSVQHRVDMQVPFERVATRLNHRRLRWRLEARRPKPECLLASRSCTACAPQRSRGVCQHGRPHITLLQPLVRGSRTKMPRTVILLCQLPSGCVVGGAIRRPPAPSWCNAPLAQT